MLNKVRFLFSLVFVRKVQTLNDFIQYAKEENWRPSIRIYLDQAGGGKYPTSYRLKVKAQTKQGTPVLYSEVRDELFRKPDEFKRGVVETLILLRVEKLKKGLRTELPNYKVSLMDSTGQRYTEDELKRNRKAASRLPLSLLSSELNTFKQGRVIT